MESSAGPDRTIDEATLEIVRTFTFENPQIVEEILNEKLLEPEDDEVTPIQNNDSSSDSKETIPEELSNIYEKPTDTATVLPKPDFGSDGYKFMTDVEEDYELPEGVYDQVSLDYFKLMSHRLSRYFLLKSFAKQATVNSTRQKN